MAQLSDSIEQFIKDLMEEDRQIDLKRNELAQHFGCAPSQINYVLATRFSIDHGYVIESRRGGGGYVRIIRIQRANDESSLSVLLRAHWALHRRGFGQCDHFAVAGKQDCYAQ